MFLLHILFMVKDHSHSEIWAIISDQQQGVFYMHHPTDRIAHTTAFGALAGTKNSSKGPL